MPDMYLKDSTLCVACKPALIVVTCIMHNRMCATIYVLSIFDLATEYCLHCPALRFETIWQYLGIIQFTGAYLLPASQYQALLRQSYSIINVNIAKVWWHVYSVNR